MVITATPLYGVCDHPTELVKSTHTAVSASFPHSVTLLDYPEPPRSYLPSPRSERCDAQAEDVAFMSTATLAVPKRALYRSDKFCDGFFLVIPHLENPVSGSGSTGAPPGGS